jgi:hypothetical protein
MKRQVAIFIETALAQTELEFSRLELFNDEKISVSSTIQNISDISKIFTDYSQGFTIPCSPTNNAIFQHFYQNDVDATIDYQNRYNAYIEIDTILFRRGKIQLEKTNLKNGQADSYSVTFYGAGVSLKDFFNEDKLSQLNYSSYDHDYTNTEVYNRVTIDSTVTDYDVRYPLISSNRVWQFGSSVPLPTANLPNWYEYPTNNDNNINHNDGRVFYTELFPAVRVASIFDLIESKYQITFNGIFLQSDLFRKAFLLYKNKESYHYTNNPVELNFNTSSNTLASAFNLGANSFKAIPVQLTSYGTVEHKLQFTVVSLTGAPVDYFIDVYKNGVFSSNHTGTTVGTAPQFVIDVGTNVFSYEVVTFKVRSYQATTVGIDLVYRRREVYSSIFGTNIYEDVGQCSATAITTSFTDLAGLAPDLKVSDFITGICKEFNLTVYSNTKNVFTFEPIPYWYSKGAILDITEYTDITSIEIERMKLYKSIEFKYQDSECMLNKFFLESPQNADAHGYGNTKIGFNYDGGEYKIESPFENLLHNNFGNQLQVGYCLNKELAPYIPKPCILYMNQKEFITSGHIHWDGQANITNYVPFGQDSNILFETGLIPLTLNFGEEISSFYLENNPNTIYALYYRSYLVNLYNQKNRLVKVKTILPVSLLTQLQLNDRLIIRDKRYFINEMQSDLTTGDVSFTLISDFAEVKPIKLVDTPTGTGNTLRFAILFTNGATQVRVGKSAGDVTLSSVLFTAEGYLNITVPTHAARVITITLDTDYINGNTDTNYIIINQV